MTSSNRPIRRFRCTALALFGAASVALGPAARYARAQSAPTGEAPATTTMTLGDVVALAKARAPAVHGAFARAASAEAGVDRARAGLLPSLYVQGMGAAFTTNGQVYSNGLVSNASTDSYLVASAALNFQWNVYDFGHTSNTIQAANAGVAAATLSARATEQLAMAEAAVAFFTLLADDELVRAAEAIRADREHLVAITHHLVEAGYRTPVDEARAQIGLDVAMLELSTATASRDSDSVTLATSLLLDSRATIHLSAPPSMILDPGGTTDGDAAVRARQEVAAAAARVEQARHGVDAAKSAHLPVLSAVGSGQLLYAHDVATYPGTGATTTNAPTELAQGSLMLTVPVFDALINANVRTAEAGLQEAQANLEQISLAARNDAILASRQARSARVVLEQSQRLTTGTAANLATVEERYATGIESPLTLADAQREDALARTAIVRARLAYEVAAVRLLAGLSRADELLKAR
jgi:outer membrane protein TolC